MAHTDSPADLPPGLIVTDPEGTITEFSRAATRLLGYSRDAAVGRQAIDLLIPPRLRDAHAAAAREMRKTGLDPLLDTRYETPLLCADGSELLAELTVSRIRAGSGTANATIIRPVPAGVPSPPPARPAEGELRRALAEHAEGLILVQDADGKMRWCAAHPDSGLDAADLVGASLDDLRPLVHPDDQDMIARAVDAAWADTGSVHETEIRARVSETGPWRRMRMTLRNMRGVPEVDAVVAYATDVTALRQAERSAELATTQLHTLVDAMPVGLLMLDEARRVAHVNAAAIRLAELDAEPAIEVGATLPDHGASPATRRAAFVELITGYIERGVPVRVAEHDMGGDRTIEVGYVPIRLAGTSYGHLITLRDATARAAARRALERRNRELAELAALKSEFVATVSHELRTPLTTVASLTGMLLEFAEGETWLADIARALDRNTTRLLDIVEDLLDLAGLETSTLELHEQAVDLPALLAERLAGIAASAADREVRVVREGPADHRPAVIRGDRSWLTRLIDFVLTAAVGISTAGDVVTVRCRTRGRRWELYVADRWPPGEHEGRMFTTIERRSTSGEPGAGRIGTGLGLVLARAIAERHGGTLSTCHADSDSGEPGTVVRISLPLSESSHGESRPTGR